MGRRILKVLLWTLCILIVVTAITGYLLYRSAGTAPKWYLPPDELAASRPARDGENKLIEIQTWTGARYAWDHAQATGHRPLVREPEPRLTVTFSEAEINGMLQKWFIIYGQEKVGGKSGPRVMDLISSPMVHIDPAGITMAATVPQAGSRVMSIEWRPDVLANGQLKLDLLAVRSGTLPLPEFVWSQLRTKLLEDLRRQLPRYASKAELDRGGGANSKFVSAASIEQAVDTLEHRPTINVMFLPIISEGNALPVRVEDVELSEGSVTLTVAAMPLEQRQELLAEVRK